MGKCILLITCWHGHHLRGGLCLCVQFYGGRRGRMLSRAFRFFFAGLFVFALVWLVVSHFVVSVGVRGTLGLLELVSSSLCPFARNSLMPLMLSPSPSSESV